MQITSRFRQHPRLFVDTVVAGRAVEIDPLGVGN
jgi:hypothetical protein